MNRTVWKWLFGISLVTMGLLIQFTMGVWVLFNVGAVFFYMLAMGNVNVNMNGVSFPELMSNFVGSPLFYIYLIDVILLITSVVGLILTRKQKSLS